jgi:hypothetical protein
LTKTESLHTWKSTPEPVLRLTLKSSPHIDYCRSKIIDENWVPADLEINTGTQFYGWRWNLQRTWTTAESEIFDENWVPAEPEIITGFHFYSLHRNLYGT